MKDQTLDLDNVTRIEVIDETGRAYVRWNLRDVKLSLQDDGRTVKLFLAPSKKVG